MKHDLNRNLQRRAKRLYALFACLVLALSFAVVPALSLIHILYLLEQVYELMYEVAKK